MAYTYDNSPGGDKLSVTGCEQHGGIIVTAHAFSGKTAVPVCILAEDVPEVMREMAAWAGLRYLAAEI
jgi:hypothetical protein